MADQNVEWRGSDPATAQPSTTADRSKIADVVAAGLKARYRAECRFRAYGIAAIGLSLLMLVILFTTIIGNGIGALLQTHITLEVALPADQIDPKGARNADDIKGADFRLPLFQALYTQFPDVTARGDKRNLVAMLSDGAVYDLQAKVMADPSLIGGKVSITVPLDDDFDMLAKGHVPRNLAEAERRINDKQIAWFDALSQRGMIEKKFNSALFTSGDSRQAELAGVWGAVVGSFYTLVITLLLAFPVGVAAAIYLEEYAPKNRFTDLIEVNINNLAAVPSIVFGLLGLAVFLNFFGMPRSAPLVGALVLALIVLPTIIIASRAALKSVPPSIREAALGLGASKLQMIVHHVLPLAMPGMLTGTIIGMAHALGESAPLLMIGMVAFVADVPHTPLDPATVLPVQVYLWADSPERAFVERTSAAILVLLAFLILMNSAAIWLRKKFERRW